MAEEYKEFLVSCPIFEEMLLRSGTILLKYWFSVSDEEQERRFHERMHNPIKRWKLSPMDLKSRELWVEYSKAKREVTYTGSCRTRSMSDGCATRGRSTTAFIRRSSTWKSGTGSSKSSRARDNATSKASRRKGRMSTFRFLPAPAHGASMGSAMAQEAFM